MNNLAKIITAGSAALLLSANAGADRLVMPLNGGGWHLWKDKNASWENDSLYLPSQITDIDNLPANPPTGGWDTLWKNKNSLNVNVPGTVEEYLTTSAQPSPDDSKGVSWWWRESTVPENEKGKRILLDFESVRMRAEVYIDGRLAGYDLIGETPFTVDVTDYVTPGKTHKLAVRVTNPGGNFHWQDFDRMKWGKYTIQPARGFSGMIGRVNVSAVAPLSVADIYMQNTEEPTKANAILTIDNREGKKMNADLLVSVFDRSGSGKPCMTQLLKNQEFLPGENTREIIIDMPDAKLWDIDQPNLYTCKVELKKKNNVIDNDSRTFGFRSFTVDGVGENAIFRLNGKRVVLRSAISWGYFPATGLFATPEMAARQIGTAKELGLNMLNFHRSIGSPVVLERADETGFLYYEEPGSFHSGNHDPFLRAILNEKIHRMVKRDRSHPSLVIYNLINEFGGILSKDKELVAKRMNDMRAAHAIDPSRVMTFTSGWASSKDKEEDAKAHMLPFDTTLHRKGWWDNHRAGGPATWEEGFYKSPNDNLMYSDNREEIYMRGEEGAISTPPRIELINKEIEETGKTGWDGLFWQKQYNAFKDYFDKKNLRPYFGSIDNLTRKMGNIQLDHQGRRIQGMRMQDVGDAYMINGWESMPYDNHSGVVDIYRHPKGDAETLAYYNQPLYVAVSPRSQFVKLPGEVTVDFYAVNEKDIKGAHTLEVTLTSPDGTTSLVFNKPVEIKGGDTYGQLIAENSSVCIDGKEGLWNISAILKDPAGVIVATGHDEVLGVDWNPSDLTGNGAIYGAADDPVAKFYEKTTGKKLQSYSTELGKLDWIAVNRPSLDSPTPVPGNLFTDISGKPTLREIWYSDPDLTNEAGNYEVSNISHNFVEGAQPDACIPANQQFSVLWEGELIPQASGIYLLGVETDSGVRMHIDGEQLIDEYHNTGSIEQVRPVTMEKGKPIKFRLLYRQMKPSGHITMKWSQPDAVAVDPTSLLDRVKNDGTTLLLLGSADSWMKQVADYTGIGYNGYYRVGKDWIGGVHFVKDHPLFEGLPVNDSMGWPYQGVVRDGENRYGFRLNGEELVAGSYKSWGFELGTAVGVIPCGKGKIVFSTLDIPARLNDSDAATEVARKLFVNFVKYATGDK